MTFQAFNEKLKQLINADDEVQTSSDFQCDQTGGFPTMLCVCWEKNLAWLELRYDLASEELAGVLDLYLRVCKHVFQKHVLAYCPGCDADVVLLQLELKLR